MTKLVLLTGGALNGRILSHMLKDDGIAFSLLTISPPDPPRKNASWLQFSWRFVRGRVRALPLLRRIWHTRLMPYAKPAHYVGRCNGPSMHFALEELCPEYVLMMGGGILTPWTINLARRGILNAHPGLLPYIRGVDVVRHAVLRGVPVGVTLHYIDAGIDTGRIIKRWLVPAYEGENHHQIAARADEVANLAMRWAAHSIVTGKSLESESQVERHPLCRALPQPEADAADRLISEGSACSLYLEALKKRSVPDGTELFNWAATLSGRTDLPAR